MLAGTRDKVVDVGHNAERLPHCELQLEPGVGHMIHYAQPDKVLAAVESIAAQAGETLYRHNPGAEALARASESGV